MQGFLPSLICLAVCLHYATAQWPNWIIKKGTTCEERCQTKLKMCKPVEEFMDCKCFPRKLVQNYLKYYSLPIDPLMMCMMSSPKSPKCCGVYNQQKGGIAVKNSDSEMASTIRNQSQEIQRLNDEKEQLKDKNEQLNDENEQLKKGHVSGQDNVCITNLTADMFTALGEQSRSQTSEMDQLKKNLAVMSSTIEQLDKRLDSESDALKTLTKEMDSEKDETAVMSSTMEQLEKRLDAQNQELTNLSQAWSGEPWKQFALQLHSSSAKPIGFSAEHAIVGDSPHPLRFRNVLTNEGGAFDKNTGVFTCPEAGMYYFIHHLWKDAGNSYQTVDKGICNMLVRRVNVSGFNSIATAYTNPSESADHGRYGVSSSAYVKLDVGETVEISYCTDPGTIFEQFTSFIGFRVAP